YSWTRAPGPFGQRGEIWSARGQIAFSLDTAQTPFISAGYADAPGEGLQHGDLPYITHEMDNYASTVYSQECDWNWHGLRIFAWNGGCLQVWIQDWLRALAPGPLPVAWLIRRIQIVRRRRPLRAGVCAACGYYLRASGERCPECGMILPRRQSI